MYTIAIDGGGTKTQFELYDEHGKLLEQMQLPSCHILQNEYLDVIRILQSGVMTLVNAISSKDIFISAGLAGYGKNPQMRKRIEEACAEAFAPYQHHVYSDSQIALAGALNGQDGILLIAGTGSIAFAKKAEEEYRCGGWGFMLDDAGSAYSIGKSLLAHYCCQIDGREEPTNLVEEVMQAFHIEEPYAIIPYVADVLGNRREEIARLALVVAKLAKQGNTTALGIYEEAAKSLAQCANVLGSHFDTEVELSYVGGVCKSEEVLSFLQKHLDKHIKVVAPKFGPAYGAYLLAKQIVESKEKV